MNIRAIIGPPGCGKTTNADKLKELYQAKRIVDEGESRIRKEDLRDGDLILTTQKLFPHQRNKPDITYIEWDDVVKANGQHLTLR